MTVSDSKLESFINSLTEDTSPNGAADLLIILKAAGTLMKLKPDTMTALAGGIPPSGWLPANEVWTYEAGDDPTYTFSEPIDATGKYWPGMRLKCTQGGSVKYGIVTAVGAYTASKTIITAYWGTDYNLGATITYPYYSPVKAPFGFPLDPTKWSVNLSDTTIQSQATPTENTYYNLGSLSISVPIGIWRLSFFVVVQHTGDANGPNICAALSTANNSASDADLTGNGGDITVNNSVRVPITRTKTVVLASKTTYYLNEKGQYSTNTLYARNDQSAAEIRAVCALL